MNSTMDFRGRWVLVTGASSGLGREMAFQLAREQGANLILVARRLERLNEIKVQLEHECGIDCRVIAADLADPQAVSRLYVEATAIGDIYGVILNAGVTHFGRHAALGWAAFENLLATNVTSVVRLISLLVPDLLRSNQGGGVMVVSSMAGLLPVPYQAAYAGSKAFVTNFVQSLGAELHGENISLTVFSPGGIDTEMARNSELKYFVGSILLQDAATCAREGVQAMRQRKPLYVPGFLNRCQLLLTRLVPRSLINRITRKTYRKALGAAGGLPERAP